MNDQNNSGKAVASQAASSVSVDALGATDRNQLSGLQSMLRTLRTNKEREHETLNRELDALENKISKVQNELFIIDAKEKSIRAAIRTLEDLGVTN